MKKLIIFSVVAILAVGIFSLAYPYTSQLQIAQYGPRLTARGSDLITAQKEGAVTGADDESRREQTEIYREWPVFANDEYGLSIRYPLELQVNARGTDLLNQSEAKTLVSFIKPGQRGEMGTNVTINVQPISDQPNLDAIAEQWEDRGLVLSRSETIVDGVRALRLLLATPLEGGDNLHEDVVMVRKGDSAIIFQSAGPENRDLFEQMLGTVDFSF